MARPPYTLSVFLNVPFDKGYRTLFDALVFAVHHCGFVARSAFESDDGTQVRIEKLLDIIASSKYGIHDISRTELTGRHRLPRFNMPLELGIFMGAKHFGGAQHRSKRGLVLDRDPHRYQIFCSDIAGQDIRSHRNDPVRAINAVRNWLRVTPEAESVPGGSHIVRRYGLFTDELPSLCRSLKLDRPKDLHFADYANVVVGWLRNNP